MTTLAIQQVADYYESKTTAVLRRYGPGPRVHFHTGFVDTPTPIERSVGALRRRLVAAQERMLQYTADVWRLGQTPQMKVLDVGCGLGGGAIFWAEKFCADVTAVTIAPSHINLVAMFSAQAGVESRVHPLLCDATKVPGDSLYDAIIAIDSSCHLSRPAWFQRAGALLRKGGHIFIADCFLGNPQYRVRFDEHWRASIGTLSEYRAAARDANLIEELSEDISTYTVHFWSLTSALILLESRTTEANTNTQDLDASLQVHGLMRRGLSEGGLRYQLMAFVKKKE